MRVKSTIINSTFNIIAQIIQLVLSFIVRNLFIKYIGIEFLGLSGLFTNILSALNLADLGVGTAITYYLYKPMAEKNARKIKGLMLFYKKTYYAIGIVIGVIGLIIVPFIQIFIKDQSLDLTYVRTLFIIQLAGTVSTYFLAYKRTLLFVDQKNYITAIVDSIMNITMMTIRVVTLIYLQSYIAYLIVILIQNVLGNVIISIICNRQYAFLRNKQSELEPVEIKIVFRDLKNIVIEKFVSYIHNSTDNIIISKFIGLASTGLLANYTLIYITVQSFIGQITTAVQASFGNYVNTGNSDSDVYIVYKRYNFLCYLFTSFSVVSFIVLIQPFINLWLGEDFLLSNDIIIILCISFFISTMRIPLNQMVSIYGLFKEMKSIAIFAAIVNITTSIILINHFGVVGTLFGTMISEFVYWFGQTYYILTKRLKRSYTNSIYRMLLFIFTTAIEILATLFLSDLIIRTNTIAGFIGKMVLCTIIPNSANIFIFRNSKEFIYYRELLSVACNKAFDKLFTRLKRS